MLSFHFKPKDVSWCEKLLLLKNLTVTVSKPGPWWDTYMKNSFANLTCGNVISVNTCAVNWERNRNIRTWFLKNFKALSGSWILSLFFRIICFWIWGFVLVGLCSFISLKPIKLTSTGLNILSLSSGWGFPTTYGLEPPKASRSKYKTVKQSFLRALAKFPA